MKEGAPTREEFRQLLERVEYKYILSFEAYKLEKAIEQKNPKRKEEKKTVNLPTGISEKKDLENVKQKPKDQGKVE